MFLKSFEIENLQIFIKKSKPIKLKLFDFDSLTDFELILLEEYEKNKSDDIKKVTSSCDDKNNDIKNNSIDNNSNNDNNINNNITALQAFDNINFLNHFNFTKPIKINFTEFLSSILTKNSSNSSIRNYLRINSSSNQFLNKTNINELLKVLPALNKSLITTWISDSGSITPLHYDRCHGILIQLFGYKRFLVFSPNDARSLYLYDGVKGPTHASKLRFLNQYYNIKYPASYEITLEEMDNELKEWINFNYKKLKDITPVVYDLSPGDAIYTPVGFFHEVSSVTSSISVTIPWDMTEEEIENAPFFMKS